MYSQGQEDQWIASYFGNEVGTFADFGANDGQTFSNSRALALKGWSGVLVEPSPTCFARLRELYADNKLIELHNVGMCEGNGPAILHESGAHVGNGDHGLLSTVKPSEMKRWQGTGTTFQPTEMECVTFLELLRRSEYAHFDFITIDIEGLDYEVLSQIDLTAVGCRALIVEVNDRNPRPYLDYCAGHGMRMANRNAENLFLIR